MLGRVESVPALVACAHGTRDPEGQAAVAALRTAVAAARPQVPVLEAYIDVHEPALPAVLAGTGPAVVVPLLLSSGYHLSVDIAEVVEAAGPRVRTAGGLGPDAALVAVLIDRLDAAGVTDEHAVVLAAAGSSDPGAKRDVEQTARELGHRIGRDVVPAYASAVEPRVADAVQRLAAEGRRVAVAAYLLAPGYFYDWIREVSADVHTTPLLPHAAVTGLVLRRYDEAVTGG